MGLVDIVRNKTIIGLKLTSCPEYNPIITC